MIAKINQRKLTRYFENVWLPDHRQSLHSSMVAAIRKTVADFVEFADCDPRLNEIDAESLAEFKRYSVNRKFSLAVAETRRKRIEAILQHAGLPEKPKREKDCLQAEPGRGTLRHFVRHQFPKLKPELSRHYVQSITSVVDVFCRWFGSDIEIADVTPDLIDSFEEAGGNKTNAQRLRSAMRAYDPVLFRMRMPPRAAPPLNQGNESQFLLANVYEKHYEPLALRSRRPNTKRLYRTTLRSFGKFLGRSATLDDLNDATVSKFAAWEATEKKLAKTSINKDLFNLLALWRWCHRKGLVDTWPDVQLEKAERRTPVAWEEAEIKKLYETIVSLPGMVGDHPACRWWAALILVVWDSGERIGAVMNLDWSNVDLTRKWVRFVAEDRKGGRDDSIVRLSDETVEALRYLQAKVFKQSKEGPVFPWPFARTYIFYAYARVLKRAGLPHDARSKFHRIRRTVASYAEAAGANATAMLRHSKREITESYLDPRVVKQVQPADVLFRLTTAAK